MKSQFQNPLNEEVSAAKWICIALMALACAWFLVFLLEEGIYNPDQGCDPRDLDGSPVNLKEAADNGVSVTLKNHCYTQPETK